MKFPQVEKAITEHLKSINARSDLMFRTAHELVETSLSALGEEPPTLTEEQMRSVQAAYKGGNRIECLNSAIAEAFRLVFRSEPEIPPELKPFLIIGDLQKEITIPRWKFNEDATAAFNAGVELGKKDKG